MQPAFDAWLSRNAQPLQKLTRVSWRQAAKKRLSAWMQTAVIPAGKLTVQRTDSYAAQQARREAQSQQARKSPETAAG